MCFNRIFQNSVSLLKKSESSIRVVYFIPEHMPGNSSFQMAFPLSGWYEPYTGNDFPECPVKYTHVKLKLIV